MIRIPSFTIGHIGSVGFGGMSFEELATDFIAEQAQEKAGIDPEYSRLIANSVADGDLSTQDLRNIAQTIGGAAAGGGCVAAGLAVVAPLCAAAASKIVSLFFSDAEAGITPQQYVDSIKQGLVARCPSQACKAKMAQVVDEEGAAYLAAWDALAGVGPTSIGFGPGPDPLQVATDNLAAAGAAFETNVKSRAQNLLTSSELFLEASFLDRVSKFAATVVNAYAPTCVGECDLGWLNGAADELAYEALSAERFPGNQSPTYIANFHRQQIEGHIKEQTGKAPVGVSFVVPHDYSSGNATDAFQNLPNGPATGAGSAMSQYEYDAAGNVVEKPAPASASEESSVVPVVLGVTALLAAGWAGWRLYTGRPLLPKF